METGPVALNYLTEIDEYNCGGFALGSFDWYIPDNYDKSDPFGNLEECAQDIQKDFPELTRTSWYGDVPDEYDVIGFRFGITKILSTSTWKECDYTNDFHFILRINGKWWHKPGSADIRLLDVDPDENWPNFSVPYNGRIIWFFREHKRDYDVPY